MKNTSLHAAFAGMLLAALAPASLFAQKDYSVNLVGNAHWATAPWSPTGKPGAQDRITNISGTSSYYLYLSGNQEVQSLTKVSNGNVRIGNSSAGSPVPGSYSLTVTDAIAVQQAEAGGLLFRSVDAGFWLSVTTGDLLVGGYHSDTGAVRGSVLIGSDLADYNRVNFTVNGTTRLEGFGNINIGSGGGNSDAVINLGHVVFSRSESSSYLRTGAVIDASRPHVVEVKSVQSDIGNNGLGTVSGGGILKINSDAGDAKAPVGGADFRGLVSETLKLVKDGTGVQKLSRAGGNTYSGGTLISGGVLVIDNTSGSGVGSGTTMIANGGTLAGGGIVALGSGERMVVEGGGVLAPSGGGGSERTLTFSGANTGSAPTLEMQGGSGVTFDLIGLGRHDRIALLYYEEGDLVLDGEVAINLTGTLEAGTYELFTFRSGGGSSARVASGLTGGLIAGSGFEGYSAIFHYDEAGYGGAGVIALELVAIPEPGNVVLLAIGAGALFLGMRGAVRRRGEVVE